MGSVIPAGTLAEIQGGAERISKCPTHMMSAKIKGGVEAVEVIFLIQHGL